MYYNVKNSFGLNFPKEEERNNYQMLSITDYKRLVLFEYCNVLTGREKTLSSVYFKNGPKINHDIAVYLIKTVMETFFQWSPERIKSDLTKALLEEINLSPAIKCLIIPADIDLDYDSWYFAYLLYPNLFKNSFKDVTIALYKNILEKKRARFPKKYFNGINGKQRACYCLKYYFEHHTDIDLMDKQKVYSTISNTSGKSLIDKACLKNVYDVIFPTPIDYVQQTMNWERDFQYYYHLCLFEYSQVKNESVILAAH